MALVLGFIALIGLLLSAFALTDIYRQAEPDLSMEWAVVRLSFLFTLMFIAMACITLLKVLRI